jgi:hypothetical protein
MMMMVFLSSSSLSYYSASKLMPGIKLFVQSCVHFLCSSWQIQKYFHVVGYNCSITSRFVVWDGIVTIATRHRLDDPGSNPGGGEIFCTCPDQLWGPPNFLYNGYWVSVPGVKQPGHGIDYPPPSSVEVKENVELYLYSPSGPSWADLGWTLRFISPFIFLRWLKSLYISI